MNTDKFEQELDKLITEGRRLLGTACQTRAGIAMIEDGAGLRRWSNHIILFKTLAGPIIAPWGRRIHHDGIARPIVYVEGPLAALETIKYALTEGLLIQYEDLVYAEAFTDLYEQGNYLLEQGYYLASGVVYRAVLEENLRRLCHKHACLPEKVRPTINDLNQALYKQDPPVYDKAMMLHVTSIAAVGNDAAHNNPDLSKEDVSRLRNGLLDFLSRFST